MLGHLDRYGMTVPVPIPPIGGRLFEEGLVVMRYLEGGPPLTHCDWVWWPRPSANFID